MSKAIDTARAALKLLYEDVPEIETIADIAIEVALEALFPTSKGVVACYPWRTNADLLYDAWRMGYVSGRVFDATPGIDGLWWRNLRQAGGYVDGIERIFLNTSPDGVKPYFDFRETWYADKEFDAVAFDPPYKYNGNPEGLSELSERYGVDVPARWQDRLLMMVDGLIECIRITKPGGHILVKCQDQVVSGAVRWQTQELTQVADTGARLGEKATSAATAALVDRFDMLGHHIPQPMKGRKQRHAHGRPSTLLVFRRRSELSAQVRVRKQAQAHLDLIREIEAERSRSGKTK